MRLTGFKALTLDSYGTLIDWEKGIVEALEPLTRAAKHPLSRDEILEAHARYEAVHQSLTPNKAYCDLLPVVYRRLAEEWRIPVRWSDCLAYGRTARNWPAFSDAAGALQYLKRYFKLVILSNVDNENFSGSNDKLQVDFDVIITAEDIGAYKPSSRNFEYMLSRLLELGIAKHEILHIAESVYHDLAPARQHGLASCRIFRRHDQEGYGASLNPGSLPNYDFCFASMAEFVKAHQEDLRGESEGEKEHGN